MKLNDPAKQHRVCPLGENLWCKWQQDQATKTYKGDDRSPEGISGNLKTNVPYPQ